MEKGIVVLDANEEQCQKLCTMLEEWHYPATPMHSLRDLETYIQASDCRAVILDLDTVPVDNRVLRKLKRMDQSLRIMVLSSRPFHPELEEAMSSYIYACLGKPVDPDELVYWLKTIYENDANPRRLPQS